MTVTATSKEDYNTLDSLVAELTKYGAHYPFVVCKEGGRVWVMELWRYVESINNQAQPITVEDLVEALKENMPE